MQQTPQTIQAAFETKQLKQGNDDKQQEGLKETSANEALVRDILSALRQK